MWYNQNRLLSCVLGCRIDGIYQPINNNPVYYSFQMLWPTNMTGALSAEVGRKGYRTPRYS